MSDIVERLAHANEYEPLGYVGWEAADEILRLREENARLNGKTDGGEADDCKSFGCLFESWKTHYQKLTTQNAALREENERLREEVERLKTSVGGIINARDQTENRLREENARLRRLVKTAYAEGCYDNTETEKTQDELEALWQESFAYKVILDGKND